VLRGDLDGTFYRAWQHRPSDWSGNFYSAHSAELFWIVSVIVLLCPDEVPYGTFDKQHVEVAKVGALRSQIDDHKIHHLNTLDTFSFLGLIFANVYETKQFVVMVCF
jgi:hypothetical protein